MIKRIFILSGVVALMLLLQSHEFWMQPYAYWYNPGDTVKVSLKVGENFNGEPWDLNRHRVEKMQLHHVGGVVDLKNKVKAAPKENLKFALAKEGTYLLAMESNLAFISLDGAKFSEYLEEDGLEDIAALREKNKTEADSAREFYSRYAKLLVQAGSKIDNTFAKVLGTPAEIIPVSNPYQAKYGDMLRFKALWNGKPLFGAKVKVWHFHNNRTSLQNMYAQQDGTVEVRVPGPGRYMISFVHMTPSTDPKADYRSYWASLVFGVK